MKNMSIRSLAAAALFDRMNMRLMPIAKHCEQLNKEAHGELQLAAVIEWEKFQITRDACHLLSQVCKLLDCHPCYPPQTNIISLAGRGLYKQIEDKLLPLAKETEILAQQINPIAWEQFSEGLISAWEYLCKLVDDLANENSQLPAVHNG